MARQEQKSTIFKLPIKIKVWDRETDLGLSCQCSIPTVSQKLAGMKDRPFQHIRHTSICILCVLPRHLQTDLCIAVCVDRAFELLL